MVRHNDRYADIGITCIACGLLPACRQDPRVVRLKIVRARRAGRRNAGAFSCASLGIVPTVRHADYIGSWLEVLREDNRAIVRAASQASKAADYLLGFFPGPISPRRRDGCRRSRGGVMPSLPRARVRGGRLFATGWRPRESLTAARRGEPT